MLNNDAISLLFLFSNLYKYDIFNIYNILKKTKSGEKMVTIGIVEDQKEDKEKSKDKDKDNKKKEEANKT